MTQRFDGTRDVNQATYPGSTLRCFLHFVDSELPDSGKKSTYAFSNVPDEVVTYR